VPSAQEDPQVAITKSFLSELLKFWTARSHSYGRVRYGCAIAKDGETWVNLITYVLPLHKSETDVRKYETSADYGRVKIAGGTLTLRKAEQAVRKLVQKSVLTLPRLPEVKCTVYGQLDSIRLCDSSDQHLPVLFPFHEFRFNGRERLSSEDRNILYAVDLPLFPSIESAINDYLGMRAGYPMYHGGVVCIAPDYRGRIRNLKLSTRGLEAQIHSQARSKPSDLLVKVHYETGDGEFRAGDAEIKNGVARFPAEDFPRKVCVILISRSTGELIDQNNYRGPWAYKDPRTIIESTAQDVENLALAGESQRLEFKVRVTSGPDIAKAVVSFANADGGQVLIGVSEEGEIVGIEGQKIADQIENILRSHCDVGAHLITRFFDGAPAGEEPPRV
jgi:hypothetical protein